MIAYKAAVTVFLGLGLYYMLLNAVIGFQAGAREIAWAYVAAVALAAGLAAWTLLL